MELLSLTNKAAGSVRVCTCALFLSITNAYDSEIFHVSGYKNGICSTFHPLTKVKSFMVSDLTCVKDEAKYMISFLFFFWAWLRWSQILYNFEVTYDARQKWSQIHKRLCCSFNIWKENCEVRKWHHKKKCNEFCYFCSSTLLYKLLIRQPLTIVVTMRNLGKKGPLLKILI